MVIIMTIGITDANPIIAHVLQVTLGIAMTIVARGLEDIVVLDLTGIRTYKNVLLVADTALLEQLGITHAIVVKE